LNQSRQSVPVAKPNPPRLSRHLRELAEIEDSGIFSNYGPKNTQFEHEIVERIFGSGECLTVCNATSGLMVAIREAIGEDQPGKRRYAVMPSFTFAATAHAAIWNGLTPLLCDIDSDTWLPCARAEEKLLREYAGQIAVIIPYATFGNNLDLRHYEDVSARYGVPIVVDAAGSLGSLDQDGLAFGTGSNWPIVFSMHATKAFAVGEGGVIYCADAERNRRLRAMCSFGFESPRTATLPGLNAKLSEVAALTALLQLERFPRALERRQSLFDAYCSLLPGWTFQQSCGLRQSHVFASVSLPRSLGSSRGEIIACLRDRGIGASTYFSPHLAEQPYFARHAVCGPLPVTTDIASRILTLPMFDTMTKDEVEYVVANLDSITKSIVSRNHRSRSQIHLYAPAVATASLSNGDRGSKRPVHVAPKV